MKKYKLDLGNDQYLIINEEKYNQIQEEILYEIEEIEIFFSYINSSVLAFKPFKIEDFKEIKIKKNTEKYRNRRGVKNEL